MYILRQVGINFDIINHHFILEFDGLYFVQDENKFINPNWQDPDPDPMKNVLDPAGQKSTKPNGYPDFISDCNPYYVVNYYIK